MRRLHAWILLVTLTGLVTASAEPSLKRDDSSPPEVVVFLHDEEKLLWSPPGVALGAQVPTAYRVYALEDRNWTLLAQVPGSQFSVPIPLGYDSYAVSSMVAGVESAAKAGCIVIKPGPSVGFTCKLHTPSTHIR